MIADQNFYDICFTFFILRFGYGLRPKTEVCQGQTSGYGRRWKLRLRSNTVSYTLLQVLNRKVFFNFFLGKCCQKWEKYCCHNNFKRKSCGPCHPHWKSQSRPKSRGWWFETSRWYWPWCSKFGYGFQVKVTMAFQVKILLSLKWNFL